MQKVLDFLERHVQWVAVGIAALFLVYALTSYLPAVATPVTVVLDGPPLTPGEVDPRIYGIAAGLQDRMNAPSRLKIEVPDYASRLLDARRNSAKLPKMPLQFVDSRPIEYSPAMPFDRAGDASDDQIGKVARLPELPPPLLEPAATTDFAQVVIAPPAGAPGAMTAAAPAATDLTWVRINWSLPCNVIAKAFGDVNLPLTATSTNALRVDLLREKLLPGNTWSAPELVPILPTIAMPPLPADGPANVQAQQNYLAWASTNQIAILQPEFFPVSAGGDPRMSKPVSETTIASGPGAFNAETFPPAGAPGGDTANLTAEQKAAVQAVRQRRAKEAQENKPKPPVGGGGSRGPKGAGVGGGGGGGRGGGGGGVRSSAPPTPPPFPVTPFFQPAPPGLGDSPASGSGGNPPGYPPAGPGPGMIPQMPQGPVNPTSAAPAAPTPITVTPAPNPGPWSPANVPNGIIQAWAYDITATADSTYRYRVRYKLSSPIFGIQNVAATNDLISVLALVGEDPNGWSPPITIAPLTHIYLSVAPQVGATRVAFTVFRWQAGQQHRANVFAGPGDSIGRVDGAIDYRTRWTLVEVRRDTSSNNAYALLMNADGVLRRLDFDADRVTPEYRQLTAATDAPAALGTPGAAPPGGTPAVPVGGSPGGGASNGNPNGPPPPN